MSFIKTLDERMELLRSAHSAMLSTSKHTMLMHWVKPKACAYVEQNKEKKAVYNRQYLKQYRAANFKNKRKLEFCLYKGGCCSQCGFTTTEDTIAAFDFHHIDDSDKEYTLSDMLMLKKNKVLKELRHLYPFVFKLPPDFTSQTIPCQADQKVGRCRDYRKARVRAE